VTMDIDTTPFTLMEQMRFVDSIGIRV